MVSAIDQHESAMAVHMSHHLETPPTPHHPILLGCPRAGTFSALLHASNLHWSLISPTVIYKFHILLKPGLENFEHYSTSV